MLIAYLETAAGQISIGLVDISKEELAGPLHRLIRSSVRWPLSVAR